MPPHNGIIELKTVTDDKQRPVRMAMLFDCIESQMLYSTGSKAGIAQAFGVY